MTHTTIKNKALIIFAVSFAIILAGGIGDVSATEQPTALYSKIITNGDLYVKSDRSVQIPFSVTATDSFDNPIPVECDKTPETMFQTGKTTVRCMAVDSFGDEVRDSFVVTVGYEIVQIPDWLKQMTQFWTSGSIPDAQYFQTLSFLLDEKVIHVPYTKTPKSNVNHEVPNWIKVNAEKWVQGDLSNDEFSIGIQWMIDRRII